MTWADIVIFEALHCLADPTDPTFQAYMNAAIPVDQRLGLIKKYPKLVEFTARIKAVKGIKEWIENRPANEEEPF